MKHLLLTTIAVVVLVGCPTTESPEPTTTKAPDIPLWQTARIGHIEAVKHHLADGTDVNAKSSRNGSTPLHQAARNGRKEIAKLLIAKGANVNAKDKDGETPLDWVIMLNHIETADLLRKHGGKHGVINEAVREGDIEAVKEFLASGTDVNAKNKYGLTPLHRSAIMNGPTEVAELLISAGADTNAKDKHGRTPLHYSTAEGHKEINELLIAKGADVNAKEDDDQTPLDWAIQFKEPETIALLRKHDGKTGAELEAEGK